MNMNEMDPTQLSKLGDHLEKEAQNNFEPKVDINEGRRSINTPVTPVNNATPLRDKIKALEEAYRGETNPRSLSSEKKNYLDEAGNDTFYVKNISNGHIVITDLDITIQIGIVSDLLTQASLEDCYASRDIRKNLVGVNGKAPWLKRLTQQEYYDEMEKALQVKKRIDVERQQETIKQSQHQNQASGNTPFQNAPSSEPAMKIRPMVYGKLEKLRLSKDSDPENSKYGMTASDFIEWVMKESLSENELNHILGDPIVSKMHNVKAAVVDKMTIM